MDTIDKDPLEMGTKSVGTLLKRYALPAVLAMCAVSLYNIVDSIFIGHGVGAMALSGLTVTFPLMNLSSAFGVLVGVGASTLISILLGQKNIQLARKVLWNALWLNIIVGIVFMTAALVFLDDILLFFGASDSSLPYAREYMEVILYGNIVTHVYLGQNAILRSSGHARKALVATLIAVVLNAILDPIFIFGLDMGIRGASIATVIAQLVTLLWQIRIFTNPNEILHYQIHSFRFDKNIVKKCLTIGISPFLTNSTVCLVALLFNIQFQKYGGDMAVGAYGIVNRFSFLFFMITLGINQGMQPIVGYNFGAGQMNRVIKAFYLTVKVTTVVFVTCFVISELFPFFVAKLFTGDPEMIAMARQGLRITALVYPVLSFQIVSIQFFQSLGMVKKATLIILSRQFFFLVPAILIFPLFMGQDGIWWSTPFADFVTAVIAFVLFHRFNCQNTGNQ